MNNFFSMHEKLLVILSIIAVVLLIVVGGLFFLNLAFSPKPRAIPTISEPTQVPEQKLHGSSLQVIGSNPQNGSSTIPSYSTFSLTFNKQFQASDVNVSFAPSTTFTQRIDSNTLYIDAPNLQDDTQYTLTISYPNGQPTQHFFFKTAPANSSIYQDTTGQHMNDWIKTSRPDVAIYNNVPYSTADFSVAETSAADAENYAFTVTLMGTDKSKAKQAFLSWLKNTVGLSDAEISQVSIQYQ